MAASSTATIAPADDATSGPPAKPVASTTAARWKTQSWMLRVAPLGADPANPGRQGAVTARSASAAAARIGAPGGVPIMPCK